MAQQGDELIQAQAELRDFRCTVLALRQELKSTQAEAEARADRERAVQQAVAANHNEIQQLKATVAALREAIEIAHIDKGNGIEKAVISANAEIAQLHGTSRAQAEALSAKAA